jgi:hypothetical protein
MNRRLHNTASALMVPGTLLLLALMALAHSGGAIDAPASAAATTAATASATTELPTRTPGGRAGRVRHSVALPFFSFAPRG